MKIDQAAKQRIFLYTVLANLLVLAPLCDLVDIGSLSVWWLLLIMALRVEIYFTKENAK